MRRTYPIARFGLIDTTALKDATVSSNGQGNTGLFNALQPPTSHATFELNQFVLDGSKSVLDDVQAVPCWSSDVSDMEGDLTEPCEVVIEFAEQHSSVGLTLFFDDDWPREIDVAWYSLRGDLIIKKTYYPDSLEYFCEGNVQCFTKIVITIKSTTFPERFVKLRYIVYGEQLVLSNLKNAKVYEELDPISSTLSINTANVSLVDEKGDFDMTNQNGRWKAMQKEQEVRIQEYVDGNIVDCGAFYLDKWSNDKNIVTLDFIDLIGLMDKSTFYEGRYYDNKPAGDIIAEIMNDCGIPYTITEEVANILLSGYLGIQTHRAALQQVVFACGAVADCSRSDKVKIYQPDRYVSRYIPMSRKFMNSKITLDEYITAVSITCRKYSVEQEASEILDEYLQPGTHRIEFSDGYDPDSLAADGCEFITKKTNYCVLKVEEAAQCFVSGKCYKATEHTIQKKLDVIEPGEMAKTKAYSGCTLLGVERASLLAERVLDYYSNRQLVTIRYVNNGEGVGNWCQLEGRGGKASITHITSQDIDLSGGNIASATCRGYAVLITDEIYTGELFAGEDVGVL